MGTPTQSMYDRYFDLATSKYALPRNLLREMARKESNFNPEAISPKGAIGLMQIMPDFHPDVDPTDPIASIDYAGRHMRDLYDEFGSWPLALAAYNSGAGNVKEHGGIPPFEETQDYVKVITERLGMSTPIQQGTDIEALIDRRRRALRITSLPSDTTVPRDVTAAGSGEERQNILQRGVGVLRSGAEAVSSGFGAAEDFVLDIVSKVNPEYADKVRQTREEVRQNGVTDIHSPLFEILAPGGTGLGSTAGKAGILRRTLASRAPTSKVAGAIPEVSALASRLGGETFETGVKVWSSALKADNPGKLLRLTNSLPVEELSSFRAGMLEGFRENLQNMTRLTAAARKNLLSPAGRNALKQMLSDMPVDKFDDLMRLLERGQFQQWRNRALIISLVYPALRFAVPQSVWDAILPGR